MACDPYALTSVRRAKAYMRLTDADLQVPALRIYNTAAGATAATVQVTDTALVLIITGGVSAGPETLTFSDVTKDTLAELIAAITALGKGWVTTQYGPDDMSSTDLIPIVAASALGDSDAEVLFTVNNWLLERLIDAASAAIETYCDRLFLSRSLSEWYDGEGTDTLFLKQYPITAVSQISIGTVGALYVKNTQGDATYAFAKMTSTQIVLSITGGTYHGDVTTLLTFATYPTISVLAAAINAYGKGWAATIISIYDDARCTEFKATENLMCNQHGIEALVTFELPDGAISDYQVYADEGYVYSSAGFTAGNRNVLAKYTAGYATIPYALEQIVLELVAENYDASKTSRTMQSESLGDYSYTQADILISQTLADRLREWRRNV